MSRALFLAAALVATPAFAEVSYFRALPDVPVAPGLSEGQLVFDFGGDQGRMIGAAARGTGDAGAVAAFYTAALPELGWSLVPERADHHEERGRALRFQRGREHLVLEIDEREGLVTLELRFTARPANSD